MASSSRRLTVGGGSGRRQVRWSTGNASLASRERRGEDDVMTESAVPQLASVYQLRVVVRAVSPLIWRRLLVSAEATLADLHRVLQAAFGWSDDHLHRFTVHGREYDGIYDTGDVRLGELGLRVTERFVYDYDLGDLWRHDIRVEQILDRDRARTYPVCICGRRAGPPEDCGGIPGYYDLLAALADPKHEQHEEMKEWIGGAWDATRFSLEATNAGLKRIKA